MPYDCFRPHVLTLSLYKSNGNVVHHKGKFRFKERLTIGIKNGGVFKTLTNQSV